ncbi:MAG: hypothetical protein AWU59_339 [Methanolobus sp. T82-4]|nr:MAG: hypothetical protein AWU59_339 [Methanolobus sp. T82-4]
MIENIRKYDRKTDLKASILIKRKLVKKICANPAYYKYTHEIQIVWQSSACIT